MSCLITQPNGESVSIPQGSNNPLAIEFDDFDTSLAISISLWSNATGYSRKPLKVWKKDDILFDGNTAICALTEAETAAFPSSGSTWLEIKCLDENGYTVFFDQFSIRVEPRKDKGIKLTEDE